ncbi:hypothetical protein EYC84_003587 [Monilinia fructicola]|uniref:Uncharacterized protein n=1 Tax=Monilinia fructicola TaxID=38448 RepID=A0A5M9JY14_MONFR|nr:hypothetical protein EYC84_003587 [Monilinia fructicola]
MTYKYFHRLLMSSFIPFHPIPSHAILSYPSLYISISQTFVRCLLFHHLYKYNRPGKQFIRSSPVAQSHPLPE